MVKQGAPRRLADAHGFAALQGSPQPHAPVLELGIAHQLFNRLQAGNDLHQPRLVIGKGAGHHPAVAGAQLGQFGIGPGGADPLAHIQSRQWPDPIHPGDRAERLVIGKLQVAPLFNGFGQKTGVFVFKELVGEQGSIAGNDAQLAIDAIPLARWTHQAHEQAGKLAKHLLLPL